MKVISRLILLGLLFGLCSSEELNPNAPLQQAEQPTQGTPLPKPEVVTQVPLLPKPEVSTQGTSIAKPEEPTQPQTPKEQVKFNPKGVPSELTGNKLSDFYVDFVDLIKYTKNFHSWGYSRKVRSAARMAEVYSHRANYRLKKHILKTRARKIEKSADHLRILTELDQCFDPLQAMMKELPYYVQLYHYIDKNPETLSKDAADSVQYISSNKAKIGEILNKCLVQLTDMHNSKMTGFKTIHFFYYFNYIEQYLIFSKAVVKGGPIENYPERMKLMNSIIEIMERANFDLRMSNQIGDRLSLMVTLTQSIVNFTSDSTIKPEELTELIRFWITYYLHVVQPQRLQIRLFAQTLDLYDKALKRTMAKAKVLLKLSPLIFTIDNAASIWTAVWLGVVLLVFG